ncbi:type II toxin-antitoxin system RelE/ParE family toxin [Pseudorhizobium tarimense]|uniref:type II toxin-antitoxin system RelE/ParE family toxin n=1 Tax=Pseudorhizobium tarimense TaxID=1079109 RepID=UPI003395C894
MQVLWTRRYLEELEAIGDYTAERNPSAAGRIVREIHSKTASLLAGPLEDRATSMERTNLLCPAQLTSLRIGSLMIVSKSCLFSMALGCGQMKSSQPSAAIPAPPSRP